MGEIANPNSGERFWDKFGGKVQVQSGYRPLNAPVPESANYQPDNDVWIFISAGGGWDGATVKFNQARPGSSGFPIKPTTSVDRSGVYIYRLNAVGMLSYMLIAQ